MNWHDNLTTAFNALRQNRLRSILAILGIIIGVASVVTMLAVGNGTHARITSQLHSLGANLLYVLSNSNQQSSNSTKRAYLTEDDVLAIASQVPSISHVAPLISKDISVVLGNKNWTTTVVGTTPEYIAIREWSLRSGRIFTHDEVNHADKIAIIGATVAKHLFGTVAPIDQSIRIGNVPLRVIGVFKKKGQDASGWDQDDVIYIPISTAKLRVIGYKQLATRQSVSLIVAKVKNQQLMESASDRIMALINQRHQVLPEQKSPFSVRNMVSLIQQRDETSRTLTLQLAALASVALLVGGISIMNIMIVSVTERTREIGIRLSVGARQQDIRNQFIAEAILLCLVGGVLGTLTGIGLAVIFSHIGDWPVVITPSSVGLALGAAVSIGVFFGLYPAIKASRLDPITALRHE